MPEIIRGSRAPATVERAIQATDIVRSAMDRPPLLDAWVELLGRFPFQLFFTGTFDPYGRPSKPLTESRHRTTRRVHPERALKLFRAMAASINRDLYGPRWYQRDGGILWIAAIEPHKSGDPHLHALLGAERDLNECISRLSLMDWWFERAGFARCESVESEGGSRAYICKYVAKGGDIDLSPSMVRVWRERELQGLTCR